MDKPARGQSMKTKERLARWHSYQESNISTAPRYDAR
jgi:hypothetical protein